MASQINYFLETELIDSNIQSNDLFFAPTTSFQRKCKVFKKKSNRSYFQIRSKKWQKSKEISNTKNSFKLSRKIIKKTIKQVDFSHCYLSPHNTTQFIINSYESNDVNGFRFCNGTDGFGSMMGLVKKDSLEEKPQAQIEATKIVSQEIEELLQMAKVEQDSFRLYIIINRLANMVKEKEEQILVLKKKISESQESSHNQ